MNLLNPTYQNYNPVKIERTVLHLNFNKDKKDTTCVFLLLLSKVVSVNKELTHIAQGHGFNFQCPCDDHFDW